ncbi:MAG: hypothetical protein EOO43_25160, partial [Flavobacterium sp.]
MNSDYLLNPDESFSAYEFKKRAEVLIEDITKKIGQGKVTVSSLSKGDWDPHYVVPKPSLISKSRKADLLIINGAQLEIGWLPPIIRQANNSEIQPGSKGFLDLSTYMNLIQVPNNISRAQGDVHPFGNPHFALNPDNIPIVSKVVTEKLCQLDNTNCSYFETNNKAFTKKWQDKSKVWSVNFHKASHCRLAPIDPKTGRIPHVFVSGNFPDAAEKDCQKLPVIDMINYYDQLEEIRTDQKQFKYIMPLFWPDVINDYYPIAFWDSARESGWLDIAISIPAYKK